MGWEDNKTEGQTEAPKVEAKADAVAAEVKPVEAPVTEAPKEATASVAEDPKMVPQELIGKVAKKIREKSRSEIESSRSRIAALEAENAKLKAGGNAEWTEPARPDEITLTAQRAARAEFLRQQDAYGKKKYGDAYVDALELIKAQNDPHLVAKIQGAADPADTLVAEATRIAEDLEWGSDPSERNRKKEEALKAKWRQEWEAEVSSKIAVRGNQPTDVSQVRAAGGNETPKFVADSWASSLPR
jgi:hypothetical protein